MPDMPDAVMRELHDAHAAALWTFCLRLTGHDRTRAEEVVQETMLRAWRNLDALERSERPVRPWLFTVARNIVIDDWRRRRAASEIPVADVPELAEGDATDEVLLTWLVADALGTLSAAHREVLVECYYRGASVAQAAQRLGLAEGTVKSRTHYALRALRLALEERGVTP